MTQATIEVVCIDMRCFLVDATTLEPTGCNYYEPAAWHDPKGRTQMSHATWSKKHMDKLWQQYQPNYTRTAP